MLTHKALQADVHVREETIVRYFFMLTDGEEYNDTEGTDLRDTAAAELEAAKIAAEWLRDNPDPFLDDGVLKVEILDDQKQLLATIETRIDRSVTTLRAR